MKEITQCLFVLRGGTIRVRILGWNPEYVGRRDRHLRQQRFVCHPVIAFGAVRRYVAFVSPEKENLVPGKALAVARGEQAEQSLWCRPARKIDPETIA